jgi:hypothetical protein
VLAFARDPDDRNGEQGHERALVHVATNWGNYAPSLALRIEPRTVVVDDGSAAEVGYLAVKGETSISVEDLQRGPDEHGSDCEEQLGAALAAGPRPSSDVKGEVAKEIGCSRKTVERAAMRMRRRGELAVTQGGFPRTTIWALPSGDTGPEAIRSCEDRPIESVRTRPNAVHVPTGGGEVSTDIPLFSGDCGDPARARATKRASTSADYHGEELAP